MEAATQSIAFGKASNATIFIAPQAGDNLGVGIEARSILEARLSTAGMQGGRQPTRRHQSAHGGS
jgi:hypothetical protein